MHRDATSARTTLPHLLARRGLRLTGPRRAVLEVLAESPAPVTVAEIQERLGSKRPNIVSVYRTVNLLVRINLLRQTDSPRGSRRYELSEQFTGHHHHLICQGCGRIEDLEGCVLPDATLAQLTRHLDRARNFKVIEHELRLFGLCPRCAA